jgi:hypothetical protein
MSDASDRIADQAGLLISLLHERDSRWQKPYRSLLSYYPSSTFPERIGVKIVLQ